MSEEYVMYTEKHVLDKTISLLMAAQSAGAIECTNCISAEG